MTLTFYIGFFGWIFYIATCILYNYVKIEKWKIKPRYFVSNQWRVFFALVALIVMTIDKGFDPANRFFYQLWKVSPDITYIASSFGLFFDPGLNGLRDLKWNYRGADSGWMDSMKLAIYYVVKALCLVALIWSTIILWH